MKNSSNVSRRQRIRKQKKKSANHQQRDVGTMSIGLGFKGVPSAYLQGTKNKKIKGWQKENKKYRKIS